MHDTLYCKNCMPHFGDRNKVIYSILFHYFYKKDDDEDGNGHQFQCLCQKWFPLFKDKIVNVVEDK